MKLAILPALFCLGSASLQSPSPSDAPEVLFKQWKEEFGVSPRTLQEEKEMFASFTRSVQQVIEHNTQSAAPWAMTLNRFAARTPPMGYKASSPSLSSSSLHAPPPPSSSLTQLPTSIDWRLHDGVNAVSPVKDQGEGNTCWSFSTAEAIEGANVLAAKNPLVSISNQYLIDCIHNGGDSCNTDSNTMTMAFDFIVAKGGGMYTYDSYPYVDGGCVFWDGPHGCHINTTDKMVPNLKVNGYIHTVVGNSSSLLQAVARGPVSVAIDANGISLYKNGVWDGKCGNTAASLNHAVLVVGYGTDAGVDYWIVKNSWGSTWGEDGYIRMKRGVNLCGITIDASYPTVNNSSKF